MSLSDFSKSTVRIVELILDRCVNDFGNSPCTASGSSKCYRTKTTCQDVNNFEIEDWTIRLIDADCIMPSNIEAHPCILNISQPSTQIDETRGLSAIGNVNLTVADFPCKVDDLDPYFSEREQKGHFWRRLKAITRHYEGRTLRIYDGCLEDDGTFSVSSPDTEKREYLITAINGPTDGNTVTITAKEPFEKLKVNFPLASSAELYAAITDSDTTLNVSGENLDAEYLDDDGELPTPSTPIYIKIEDEFLKVTGRSGTGNGTFTVERGQLGTTAAAHDIEEPVNQIGVLDGNPAELWERLLLFCDIPSSQIDTTGSAIEENAGLNQYDMYRIVAEPTRVTDLLRNMLECCLSFTWWDAESQTVKLKMMRPVRPDETLVTLTDDNLVGGRPAPKEHVDKRITCCTIHYDIIDPAGDRNKISNYRYTQRYIDLDAEGPSEHNKRTEKIIFCPWFSYSDKVTVFAISTRWVSRYGIAPTSLPLMIEAADAVTLKPGDLVAVKTAAVEDASGDNPTVQGWIRGKKKKSGNTIIHEAQWMSAGFAQRYAFWAPESMRGVSYSTATDEQKAYGFWSNDEGKMPNGDQGYGWQ